MSKASEWRKNNHLSKEELDLLVDHINKNMEEANKDIKRAMELSDRTELQSQRVEGIEEILG